MLVLNRLVTEETLGALTKKKEKVQMTGIRKGHVITVVAGRMARGDTQITH